MAQPNIDQGVCLAQMSTSTTDNSLSQTKPDVETVSQLSRQRGLSKRRPIERLSPRLNDLWSCFTTDKRDVGASSVKDDPAEQARRSKEIDEYLQADFRAMRRQRQVAIVGLQNTQEYFWNQARLFHGPLTEQEKAEIHIHARKSLHEIIALSFDKALEALAGGTSPDANLAPHNPGNWVELSQPEPLDFQAMAEYVDEVVSKMASVDGLLRMQGRSFAALVCETMESCCISSALLDDDSLRSIDNLVKRVFSPLYEPTTLDWLHLDSQHAPKPILRDMKIKHGQYSIRLINLRFAGRAKLWKAIFGGIEYILHVSSLAHYDVLDPFELNPSYNQLKMSIWTFGSLVRSSQGRNARILVVLFDKSALKQKLESTPLSNYFPDYKGDGGLEEAEKYICSQYKEAAGDYDNWEMRVCDVLNEEALETIFEVMMPFETD
ncbi:hypothetical protein B0I35DRAFT_444506 [Stachybotrys elegans]|uniref:Uncharacterized protein n=1 Tax=Stachybotrys elegans TaxID=80388 RepID=A0A8K0SDA8_9HYPO|nr:hypothetical protein B0I35DRAFT_444506 [Stachybotrys elegans]